MITNVIFKTLDPTALCVSVIFQNVTLGNWDAIIYQGPKSFAGKITSLDDKNLENNIKNWFLLNSNIPSQPLMIIIQISLMHQPIFSFVFVKILSVQRLACLKVDVHLSRDKTKFHHKGANISPILNKTGSPTEKDKKFFSCICIS